MRRTMDRVCNIKLHGMLFLLHDCLSPTNAEMLNDLYMMIAFVAVSLAPISAGWDEGGMARGVEVNEADHMMRVQAAATFEISQNRNTTISAIRKRSNIDYGLFVSSRKACTRASNV
jgi:hypothetical protein